MNAPLVFGTPFSPYRMFHGAIVPNWLLRRREISQGAKLCYARMTQYYGKTERCVPKQSTLADELGVSERQVREYVSELADVALIKTDQRGLGQSNSYEFLWHEWITDESGDSRPEVKFLPDRKNTAGQAGSKLPVNTIDQENQLNTLTDGSDDSIPEAPGNVPNTTREFVMAWCREYRKHKKCRYAVNWGRDGANAKTLLSSKLPISELIGVAIQAWQRPGAFYCKFAAAIPSFASHFNAIRSELQALDSSPAALVANDRSRAPEPPPRLSPSVEAIALQKERGPLAELAQEWSDLFRQQSHLKTPEELARQKKRKERIKAIDKRLVELGVAVEYHD